MRRQRLASRVDLHLALGGGFELAPRTRAETASGVPGDG